jgi:hypothetical protein
VKAVDPATRGILIGRREKDLHRAEQQEPEAPADPLPEAPESNQRGEEDDRLGAVDEQTAGDPVGVEGAFARAGEVRRDEVDLQRDADQMIDRKIRWIQVAARFFMRETLMSGAGRR